MNTLFIIGNGFDLAHGLKTGYDQFLFWLMKKELKNTFSQFNGNENNNVTNELIQSFQIGRNFSGGNRDRFIEETSKIIDASESISSIITAFVKQKHNLANLVFQNKIVENSIQKHLTPNWSDIEWQYFDLLRTNKVNAKYLNKSLDYIKKELRTYLMEVNDTENKLDAYQDIIDENAGDEDLYLNFNYTSTLSDYKLSGKEIQIHGSVLKNKTEKLVFGYGDETTEEYKKLENANDNDYLKNIKSVNYMSNYHYLNLFGFINDPIGKSIPKDYKASFNVVILGHSCGLSDRVLLKEIFEHDNCKSIKVYHYEGLNSFLQTTMNISRHFDKNVNMRNKIQTFDPKYKMPQWNDKT